MFISELSEREIKAKNGLEEMTSKVKTLEK
jgi:hypothetical protein